MRARLAIGLLFLMACQSGAVAGSRCARTNDCASALVCRFGACRAECAENRDCPAGASCLRAEDAVGVCGVASDLGCETGVGTACPSGLTCAADRCVRACATSADCPLDGECVAMPGTTVSFCLDPRVSPGDSGTVPVDASDAQQGLPDGGPLDAGPYPAVVEATLVASDGMEMNSLGSAVALAGDGTLALLGSVGGGPTGDAVGSARLYTFAGAATWNEAPALLPTAPDARDAFGFAVALAADGTRAIVGASGDDTTMFGDEGSAWIFVRTGSAWSLETTLLAPDAERNDHFGHAVAFDADATRAIVGLTRAASNGGGAYVFVRTGTSWAFETALRPSTGTQEARASFGAPVLLSSDASRAIVGMSNDVVGGVITGSARVFVRTGVAWTEEATLAVTGAAEYDLVGASAAIDRDATRVLLGSPGAILGDAGRANVFVRTGTSWTEEATLLAPDGTRGDFYGSAVALDGAGLRAVVTAPNDDTRLGTQRGSLHVLERVGSTWSESGMLVLEDGHTGDGFGSAIALSADGLTAIVGAPFHDSAGGGQSGSGHVVRLPP